MFAVAASRNIINRRNNHMENFSIMKGEDFLDFSSSTDCNLLDSIDFDQLFDVGINEGDVLPDLDNFLKDYDENLLSEEGELNFIDNKKHSASDLGWSHEEDNNNNGVGVNLMNQSPKAAANNNNGKKSSTNSANKNAHGKTKVKVDWTAELHKRFVEAVEKLGVDKAVPSRILELMGIQCLTRHNIASHLQKYRSHRKHMVAREAEAANWNERRQVYQGKRDKLNPWVAPTIGFPPPPHFRPLHVWGHPYVDQSLLHMWPKHISPSPSPSPSPRPLPSWPPINPSFWHSNHQHAGFAPPPPIQRLFTSEAVPGIPPASIKPPLDVQPTKESIDAAVGDVLANPWLPLPLGLRPPSTDCVLGELQRQGVSKIPPS